MGTKMKALSLDMGGSHVGCAVVEEEKILAHCVLEVEQAPGLTALLDPLVRTLYELLQSVDLTTADCSGIDIGFPGIVDFRTGTIQASLKKYEDARAMDLSGWCKEQFHLPLAMENDARMALLG